MVHWVDRTTKLGVSSITDAKLVFKTEFLENQ